MSADAENVNWLLSTFVTRIAIAAPPAVVWDVMTRFEQWPEWTASVTSLEALTSSPPGLGARYRIVQPSLHPSELTITDWQPGSRFVWAARKTGLVMTADHVIQAVVLAVADQLGAAHPGQRLCRHAGPPAPIPTE